MDKNQATGLILFAAVILVYSIFFASTPEIPPSEEITATEQKSTPVSNHPTTEGSLPDSIADATRMAKFGALAGLTLGEEKEQILENDLVKITISTKGGEIKEVLLKNYQSWTNEPLKIFEKGTSTLSFSADTKLGTFNLNEFYFKPEVSQLATEGIKQQVLTLTAETESGKIIQKFILSDGSYVVQKSLEIERYEGIFDSKALKIQWDDQIKAQEKDLAESRRKTQINYYLANGAYENLGLSDDPEEALVDQPVKWV